MAQMSSSDPPSPMKPASLMRSSVSGTPSTNRRKLGPTKTEEDPPKRSDVSGEVKRGSPDLLLAVPHFSLLADGPFRATELWNDLVQTLQSRVVVKRRRIHRHKFDKCFTGSDAVDIVLSYLLDDQHSFINKKITRENAFKLCQLMLDSCIFEPAQTKHASSEKSMVFEDSSVKFYSFIFDHTEPNDVKENTGAQDCQGMSDLAIVESRMRDASEASGESSETSSISSQCSMIPSNGKVVQEMLGLTGTRRRHSINDFHYKPHMTPSQLSSSRKSVPDLQSSSATKVPRLTSIPPAVQEEVVRETALSQLLTMMEISNLDPILAYDPAIAAAAITSRKGTAYTNLAFRRCESICSIFNSSGSKYEEDSWWECGLDCLESHPNGLDILDTSLCEDTKLTQKLRLFQALADYYTNISQPLWPDCFIDIHVGLLKMLMEGRMDQVLRGLQLSILLLPLLIREEIRKLIVFMAQAASDESIQLSSKEDNRNHVIKVFTDSILRNRLMAPSQAGQLVLFMMDRWGVVWEMPDDVEEAVKARLSCLGVGNRDALPRMGVVFCNQVSQAEFFKQQTENTELAMVDLMNSILDDTQFTLKEKKQKLKFLQKQHPSVYHKHFSDVKW